MRAWGAIFAVLLAFPAHAVELSGTYMQGGLVIGKAAPGSRVRLDGEALFVAADGTFIFGFSRDHAETSELIVTGPGGEEHVQLAIQPQAYDIQKIDGLPERKVTPKPEDVARIKADNEQIWTVRGQLSPEPWFARLGFVQPAEGPVSGVFGSQRILNGIPKNPHNGLDIAGPEGAPVVAPADGIVALVHNDMFYTGKTVMIDHGLGLTSVYAHMSAITVKQGQQVKKGAPIGAIGQTGRVTGPHLHWGVTWKGMHLDPLLVAGPVNNPEAKN